MLGITPTFGGFFEQPSSALDALVQWTDRDRVCSEDEADREL
jgi:hypothetical protein